MDLFISEHCNGIVEKVKFLRCISSENIVEIIADNIGSYNDLEGAWRDEGITPFPEHGRRTMMTSTEIMQSSPVIFVYLCIKFNILKESNFLPLSDYLLDPKSEYDYSLLIDIIYDIWCNFN